MDNDTRDFLSDLEDVLDATLSGKPPKQVVFAKEEMKNPELKRLAEKTERLFSDFAEVNQMVMELSHGKLDGFAPSRKNILAGPFKQMQSQFSTLVWHIRELLKGKIVSKLEEDGELFQVINELIDQVASASTGASAHADFTLLNEDEQKMNSWRYHQILMAVNMLAIMVIEVDEAGKIVYANKPGKDFLNGREILCPKTIDEDTDFLTAHLCTLHQGKPKYPITTELADKTTGKWCKVTSDTFTLPNGQRLFLHVIDDVTDWKQNEKRLETSANIDPLTGLLNRRAGLNILRALQEDTSGATHCVAFIDIDDLKRVNDEHGHSEGDVYICTVADILKSSVRSTESVIRYGGDEFFVVFRDCGLDLANKVLQRMQANLDQINQKEGHPYKMSFSYGVNVFGGKQDQPLEELLDNVDEKMYINKNKKKKSRTNLL